MRLITVVLNDKKNHKTVAMSVSVLKNNIRTLEDLKVLFRGAIEDFFGNDKIEYKPKEITWENLSVIPVYITQENGFKILRVYKDNEVFTDDLSSKL